MSLPKKILVELVIIALVTLFVVVTCKLWFHAGYYRSWEIALVFAILLSAVRPVFGYCRLVWTLHGPRVRPLAPVLALITASVFYLSVVFPGFLIVWFTGDVMYVRLMTIAQQYSALLLSALLVGIVGWFVFHRLIPAPSDTLGNGQR
jgi:hypothetical protein